MDTNNTTMNISHILHLLTCKEIEEFLSDTSAYENLSLNLTYGEFFNLYRSPHCQPKPYVDIEGVAKWIVIVVLTSFLIFGLLGNILSAVIMFRRSRPGVSSYFYLGLLAVVDILILYTSCLFYLLEKLNGFQPKLHSNFLCQSISYIEHVLSYMSSWLIVAVTFERFIVVRFPLQSIHLCRLRVAYTIVLSMLVFFIIYTTHCFLTMKLFSIDLQSDNGYHPNYIVCDIFIHRYILSFIDLCFYCVLPSTLIIICNILIILTIFHATKKRRDILQGNNSNETYELSQRNKTKSSSIIRTQFFRSRSAESNPPGRFSNQINKQRIYRHSYANNCGKKPNCLLKTSLLDSRSAPGIRLTCLLLAVSFVYVLCTLPISIRLWMTEYSKLKNTTNWHVTQSFLTILMYFNHTANFILYCSTGRVFRSECRKILSNIWIFKYIHISCIKTSGPDKKPQYNCIPKERNRFSVENQRMQQKPNQVNG